MTTKVSVLKVRPVKVPNTPEPLPSGTLRVLGTMRPDGSISLACSALTEILLPFPKDRKPGEWEARATRQMQRFQKERQADQLKRLLLEECSICACGTEVSYKGEYRKAVAHLIYGTITCPDCAEATGQRLLAKAATEAGPGDTLPAVARMMASAAKREAVAHG